MKWHFLETGFNTGSFNMDFDLSLVKNRSGEDAYFRLYRWEPFCISIGANQNFNSVDSDMAREDNIDIVQRPTGGRAILHSEELTYSVVCPLNKISSLKKFYCEINKALREGLIIYDQRLTSLEFESDQPDFRDFYKQPVSEICFAVSAKSEIQFEGKKLVGSAQRKINNSILQHGSILCGDYHKKITSYLHLKNEELVNMNNEISYRTTDLRTITNTGVDYEKLSESLARGFEKYFNIKFEKSFPEFIH